MDRHARTINSSKQIECVYRVAGGKAKLQHIHMLLGAGCPLR